MERARQAVLILCLLLSAVTMAGSDKILLSSFISSARMEMNISTNALLPDSVMVDFGSRALVKTASEIGGVESAFWVTMVADQMLYAIPDTVVEIIQASLISGDVIVDIRAFAPQYFNEQWDMNPFKATDEQPDDRPVAYSLWDDTIQLYPVPVNTDSIYFLCYIEHPVCDSVSDTVYLKSDYQEAAKSYLIYLAYKRLQEYEVADYYLKDYDRQKQILIAKHQPKIEPKRVEK